MKFDAEHFNSWLNHQIRLKGISSIQKQTGLSRSHIYGILNNKIDPQLTTLRKILNCIGFDLEVSDIKTQGLKTTQTSLSDIDFLKWNLAYYGAPLIVENNATYKAQPIDLVLLSAQEVARSQPVIHAILSIFILKNWNELKDTFLNSSQIDTRYIGYTLNLIFRFTNNPEIGRLYLKFYKPIYKKKSEHLFYKKQYSEFEKKIISQTDNVVAQSWGYLTTENLYDIEARFKKWANA